MAGSSKKEVATAAPEVQAPDLDLQVKLAAPPPEGYPRDLKQKINKALGTPIKEIPKMDPFTLIQELAETCLMFDDDGVLTELNKLRSQLKGAHTQIQSLRKAAGLPPIDAPPAAAPAPAPPAVPAPPPPPPPVDPALKTRCEQAEAEVQRLRDTVDDDMRLLDEATMLYDRIKQDRDEVAAQMEKLRAPKAPT